MTFRSAAELASNPALTAPPAIVAPPLCVLGFVVLLVIGPKGGKSTTAAGQMAEASRRGLKCGLVTIDESLATSLQRLLRFGANPELVYLTDRFDPVSLADEVATLGLEVLVVDHVSKLAELSPDFGPNSLGDSVLWGRLVSPFTQLAREQNLAVILVDQARRSDGKWAGSVGKGGAVDVLAELEPKGGCLTCQPKGRIQLPPFRVDLDPDGVPVFSDLDGEPAGKQARAGVSERHRKAVLAALQSAEPEGLTATQWQQLALERTGLARSTFFDIRRELYTNQLVSYTSRTYRVTRRGTTTLENGASPHADDDL